MKKLWSVLLSILLGAFVVGIGTGYFLYLANKDRQVLAEEANQAKLEAQQALEKSQKAIEEANNKVAEASQQVTNAQKALEALQNEQELLKDAEPLLKPNIKVTEGWVSVISTSQGISLMFPPGSTSYTNSEKLLAIGNNNSSSTPWLKIVPYSDTVNNELSINIVSSTKVSYFIDGKVVAGREGEDKNTGTKTALLKSYTNGTSTHIIWIQDPPPFKIKSWLKKQSVSFLEILKTFEFQK